MSVTENELAKLILPLRRDVANGKAELVRDSIDGRPLYQYRINAEKLDLLEAKLSHRLCSDSARVQILAPLAAGKFAVNYNDGALSWDDCGPVVAALYKANGGRFRSLMADSLARYRIDILKRGKIELLLETVVGQAGLPSAMLAAGKPLRELLDALMKQAVDGWDIVESAGELVQKAKLRQAYKEAGHLPDLCVKLVKAVDGLKRESGWDGGLLDAIWSVPSWTKRLPFLVPEERAREIVTRLVNVAAEAADAAPLAINRILAKIGDGWALRARVAYPERGYDLGQPNLPEMLALRYAVDDQPIDEACRLRRQGSGTKYALARATQELSEAFASPARTLALTMDAGSGAMTKMACQGGERLDPELPWVFSAGRDGRHRYLGTGGLRAKDAELLVAASERTVVTGEAAVEPGALQVAAGEGMSTRRIVWRVQGTACFELAGETSRVQAGYTGPQVLLKFAGTPANVHVPGCSAAYVGDPRPKREGGFAERIEWRQSGDAQWRAGSVGSTGKIRCRLVDERGGVLEERSVFVFPRSFECKTFHKRVDLALGPEFNVPDHTRLPGDRWSIQFSETSQLDVRICAPGGEFKLSFTKLRPTSFFNVVTGEQIDSRAHPVSSLEIGALMARSSQHDRILVQRKSDAWDEVRPFALHENTLRLAELKPYLNALAFDPTGKTRTLKIEFPNHAGLEVEAYRIKWQGDRVSISGAGERMEIELHDLVPAPGETPEVIALKRLDKENWALPALRSGSMYLAIDTSRQAAPCLVKGLTINNQGSELSFLGCVAEGNEHERLGRLGELYERITSQPSDGFNSTQIDDCLDWLGRFQHCLPWLDPFLVLASSPTHALRMLALARLRANVPAQQGLLWALDEVPLFWHQLTGRVTDDVLAWAGSQWGSPASLETKALLEQLPLQAVLQELSSGDLARLIPVYKLWRDGWQLRVLEWSEDSGGLSATRSRNVGETANAVWDTLLGSIQLQSLLTSRCLQVPNTIEDINRTHLMAPLDLALCIAHQPKMPSALRDDLIYARYAISTDAFDDAFCIAATLMERMK